jgi:hypothetical protein
MTDWSYMLACENWNIRSIGSHCIVLLAARRRDFSRGLARTAI